MVDERTGEVFRSKNGPFEMVRTKELCGILEKFRVKGKILAYLFQKKNRNNTILKTVTEIADELEVSAQTVSTFLCELEKADAIKRRYGVVMISPTLIHYGGTQREAYLKKMYERFGESGAVPDDSEEIAASEETEETNEDHCCVGDD